MTVQLKPETERLVNEEIQCGRFDSIDDMIVQGVYARRENSKLESASQLSSPRKSLYELLTTPPFAGSELNIERQKD